MLHKLLTPIFLLQGYLLGCVAIDSPVYFPAAPQPIPFDLDESGSLCPWVRDVASNEASALPTHRCQNREDRNPKTKSDANREKPRPLEGSSLGFPPCLKKYVADGRVVLELALDETGRVTWAGVQSTNMHPDFGDYAAIAVRSWEFTIPRNADGEPTRACARLPIPISIGGPRETPDRPGSN